MTLATIVLVLVILFAAVVLLGSGVLVLAVYSRQARGAHHLHNITDEDSVWPPPLPERFDPPPHPDGGVAP